MNIKEVAKLFNIKEQDKSMKNKEKAKEIIDKILKCNKCGEAMHWVENTNICVCSNCTYTVGKKENARVYSVSRTLPEKSRRFLENNYSNIVLSESKEV